MSDFLHSKCAKRRRICGTSRAVYNFGLFQEVFENLELNKLAINLLPIASERVFMRYVCQLWNSNLVTLKTNSQLYFFIFTFLIWFGKYSIMNKFRKFDRLTDRPDHREVSPHPITIYNLAFRCDFNVPQKDGKITNNARKTKRMQFETLKISQLTLI